MMNHIRSSEIGLMPGHVHLFVLVILFPGVAHGGRYSEMDTSNLAKLVTPLVFVGVILFIMLTLLAVFYRKKRPQCPCICCREFYNKHTRMTSAATQCQCAVNKVVVSERMCDMCVKWQTVPNGLPERSDSTDTGDSEMTPPIRICRCSTSNSCGSPVCHVIDTTNVDGQDSGIVLTLENVTTKHSVVPPGDETGMITSESCACPCAASFTPDPSTSVARKSTKSTKSANFIKTQDKETDNLSNCPLIHHLLERELSAPSGDTQKNLV